MACVKACFKSCTTSWNDRHSACSAPGEAWSPSSSKVNSSLEAASPVAHLGVPALSTRGQTEPATDAKQRLSVSLKALDFTTYLHDLQIALSLVDGVGFESRASQLIWCIQEHLGPECVVRLFGLAAGSSDPSSGQAPRQYLVQLAASSPPGLPGPACKYDKLPGRYFTLTSFSGQFTPPMLACAGETTRGLAGACKVLAGDTAEATLLMERALGAKAPAVHQIDRSPLSTPPAASARQSTDQQAAQNAASPGRPATMPRIGLGPYLRSLQSGLEGRMHPRSSPPPSPSPPTPLSTSTPHPRDCLSDLSCLPGTCPLTFAALPLSCGRRQVAVLWVVMREPRTTTSMEAREQPLRGGNPRTDNTHDSAHRIRLGLALLRDPTALAQLALTLSLALATTLADPDYVSWLAGSVRRLAKCSNLQTLVAGACMAVSQHVRWKFHADVAVQSALVPEPNSPVAFMLYPTAKAGGPGAPAQLPGRHIGRGSCDYGGPARADASDRPFSVSDRQLFVRPHSFTAAAAAPKACVNPKLLSLSAKAFQISHTLLLQLIKSYRSYHRDVRPRTAQDLPPLPQSMGSEANSGPEVVAIAASTEEGVHARVPHGIIIPDTARHVADVRQPSRDVCMLLCSKNAMTVAAAAAAEAWNPPGVSADGLTSCDGQATTPTGQDVQGRRRGAASLVLMTLEVAEGGCLLGLYIAFPTLMPLPLLEAARDSCGHFLRQVLADLIWHKLRTPEMAVDFDTLRAGVPGSYVSTSGPRAKLDQGGLLTQPPASPVPTSVRPRTAPTVPASSLKTKPTASAAARAEIHGLGPAGSTGPAGSGNSAPVSERNSQVPPACSFTGGLPVDVNGSNAPPGPSGHQLNGGCFLARSSALARDLDSAAAASSGEVALDSPTGSGFHAGTVTVHDLDEAWGMRGIMRALVDSIMMTLRGSSALEPQQGDDGTDLPSRATEGLDDLQLMDVLGHGASGVVLQGLLGTVPVAVKVMEMSDADQDRRSLARESGALVSSELSFSHQTSTPRGRPVNGPANSSQRCTQEDNVDKSSIIVRSLASMALPANMGGGNGGAGGGGGGGGGAGGGFGSGNLGCNDSNQLRARRTMMRNATELAVMRTVSHVNIVQVFAVYDNVIMERTATCMDGFRLRRLDAKNPGTGGSPICTAIVQELCDCGSLEDVLVARQFPIDISAANAAPAAASLSSRVLGQRCDSSGIGRSGSSGLPMPRSGRGPGEQAGRRGGLEVDMRSVYLTLLEVALALRHLHARRLVHRDLKPANILLKASLTDPRGWTCKLADFGFALVLEQQHPQRDLKEPGDPEPSGGGTPSSSTIGGAHHRGWFTVQAEACGTVTHMAPEAMTKDSRIDASVDMFSFGVICWELVCGRGHRPFRHLAPHDIPAAVKGGARPVFPPEVPLAYRNLAAACWSEDPSRRPRAADVVLYIKSQLALLQAQHR